VSNSLPAKLTDLQRVFLEPKNAVHRQYEALRAFFVEGLASATAAQRFGYTPGSFRILCHELRQQPDRDFFLSSRRAPPGPPRDRVREAIIALRKQNLSIYDISRALVAEGEKRSPAAVSLILKDEGFDFVEVPDEEFDTMAPNVLALAPRECIMIEGNPITKARLEATGCRVRTYHGKEISLKAEGGATCLTRPILRKR